MGYKMRTFALFICVIMVFSSVIDIDHIPYYMGLTANGRPLHPFLLPMGSGFIACGIILIVSLVWRLRSRRILNG